MVGVQKGAVGSPSSDPEKQLPGISLKAAPLPQGVVDLISVACGNVIPDAGDGGLIFVPAY
jgi:hypothetical protein